MTSKFEKPTIRFKSPAVCKKSPPGPDVNSFPATIMSSFFMWKGTDTDGIPIDFNETLSLTYTNPGFDLWSTTFETATGRWEITLQFFSAFNLWQLSGNLIRASLLKANGQLNGWEPRTLDPFDSNYLPLTVPVGSGISAARIML